VALAAVAPAVEDGVTVLTPDNFKDVVGKDVPVFVEFYAPWCGHCKSLAPEWAAAADANTGAKFAALDATAHADVASKFGVKGYPTILAFPPGAAKAGDGKPYNGPRTADALIDAARVAVAAAGGAAPAPVAQLTSAAAWADACGPGAKGLCVLAVLPHILDDGAAKRSARLAALGEGAAKQRSARFFWSEVGAQPGLEGALNVGLVPAVFAVSGDKRVFTTHKGAFTGDAIGAFAKGLTTNKGAGGALPLPAGFDVAAAAKDAPAWDGKDGKAADSGEIDLAELDL